MLCCTRSARATARLAASSPPPSRRPSPPSAFSVPCFSPNTATRCSTSTPSSPRSAAQPTASSTTSSSSGGLPIPTGGSSSSSWPSARPRCWRATHGGASAMAASSRAGQTTRAASPTASTGCRSSSRASRQRCRTAGPRCRGCSRRQRRGERRARRCPALPVDELAPRARRTTRRRRRRVLRTRLAAPSPPRDWHNLGRAEGWGRAATQRQQTFRLELSTEVRAPSVYSNERFY
mmetsp:Transcript_41793/g.138586  ORF Transcript_41793/g.138586 Transcript_41793/m.138586 type:complete len:235 (-) Transcript_41793:75-779(-)